MTAFPWHRVFHPLCGADPLTLAALVLRNGPPSRAGLPAFAVACASSLARLPFTAIEAAIDLAPCQPPPPPVFIVGYPRSGTTHLHNLMAASGAFATAPPVLAAMPWEGRTLARILKPLIDPFLPRTRLIDEVAFGPDTPTEDEVGLANLATGSYFHAVYFPRAFARAYRDGLALRPSPRRVRAVRRYVAAMARRGGRPLLLKNPAYTAQIGALLDLFPGARVVHIHRDPRAVFGSSRRALGRTLDELALQDWSRADLDAAIIETYPLVMRQLRAQAAGLPPHRFTEVAYEDTVRDPAGVLRRLWRDLDLPPAGAGRVDAHLASVAGFRAVGGRLDARDRARVEAAWPEEMALYGRP